ncbi:hypothetical protein ABEF95_009123 [Exophiala dermatitidis]
MNDRDSTKRASARTMSNASSAVKGSRGRPRTQGKEQILASLKTLLDSDKDGDEFTSAPAAAPAPPPPTKGSTSSHEATEMSMPAGSPPLHTGLQTPVSLDWPDLSVTCPFGTFSPIDFSGTGFSEHVPDLTTDPTFADLLVSSKATSTHLHWPHMQEPSHMQQHNAASRQSIPLSVATPGPCVDAVGGIEFNMMDAPHTETFQPHGTEVGRSTIQPQQQGQRHKPTPYFDPNHAAAPSSGSSCVLAQTHSSTTSGNNSGSGQYSPPTKYERPRLPRRRTQPDSASAPGSGSGNSSGVGASRPKVDRAHSLIERRYRARLQDKFQTLRDCVARWKQAELDSDSGEQEEDASGFKMNKASVLTEAVMCISHLEEENEYLYTELEAIIDYVQVVKKRNDVGGGGVGGAENSRLPYNNNNNKCSNSNTNANNTTTEHNTSSTTDISGPSW